MTYSQYEQTRFIENVEEANSRLNELEVRCGKAASPFEVNLEAVNRRIWELEGGTTTTTAPAAEAKVEDLPALKARACWLMQCLGLDPKFQAECKTAAEYKVQIAKLEARLQKANAPKPVAKAPAPPLNSTVAFYKTGKARGLSKAMGAAAEKAGC